jgi:hypothetical protein
MTQITAPSFTSLKAPLMENFNKRFKDLPLFTVELDRDKIVETYLSSFPEELRQEHNCSCCKSFLRQFAGIVTIQENKMVTLWDNLQVEGFQDVINNINEYVHSLPISSTLLTDAKKAGTDKNTDPKTNITWQHFFLELPNNVVAKKADIPTRKGEARTNKEVLQRGLEELTLEATETVLELIGQNSLYRGKEFEPLLKAFALVQRRFAKATDKNTFCWEVAGESGGSLARIKNTAIGTLLVDLSGGMDLDLAVTRFEKVVAPTNYKRPTALVTPRMIEDAKAKLSELGLVESLNRRYATETDIQVCDILFKDRAQAVTDIFDEMSKETLVNPKSLTKVEEITIEDFLANVVPTAKSISVLVENQHLPNFVSLLTSQEPDAPHLFKWNNNFSWSYTGAIADSIKERVKAAGGNVVGELRTSLSWYNYDDLDIHVVEPGGNTIYFSSKLSATSGKLDVDMNAGGGTTRTPVENIIWTNKNTMKEGTYKVRVNNFARRETINSGYVVQIECNGETFDFETDRSPMDRQTQTVAEFEYSKTDGIKFKGETKSNMVSKDKWGLKTCQFRKVTNLMLSPNHWGGQVGNRHYFFMLEDCISDEAPRPFFNEFLRPEMDQHRKVFEILGGKVKIEDSNNQLSGLGFSDTKRSDIIVKVTGKFTRTLKVKI